MWRVGKEDQYAASEGLKESSIWDGARERGTDVLSTVARRNEGWST